MIRSRFNAVVLWACAFAVMANLGHVLAMPYSYVVPEKTNDGWQTASLENESVASEKIISMVEGIRSGEYKNISSVLIVRDGKLILEEYFPRDEADQRAKAFRRVAPQEITSATKSVTSALIGIAIDRHLIRDVDEKVSTFFPDYTDLFADEAKGKLRLRDLLTMSAGLSWDEWTVPYGDPRNSHIQMLRSPDPVRFVLEQKAVAPPGTRFDYSSGISLALGQIIRRVSGLPVDKFAERNLFEPLGITDFYWSKYPDEIVQAGGGLFIRPRDVAKIGHLYLDGGRWNGKQVVSERWIKESTTKHISASLIPKAARADGYGYQWWLSSIPNGEHAIDTYSARGRGGQFVLIAPAERLVIVFTSPPENPFTFQPLDLIERHILPAFQETLVDQAK